MPRSYTRKENEQKREKRAVAEVVWSRFIQHDPNPRVFIDAGSSAALVLSVIRDKREETDTAPVVMTHNWAAWTALRDQTDMDVYFIGGKYSVMLNACIEPQIFQSQIRELTPNLMVIAVSGIDKEGLYCSNHQDEAPIKAAIARKPVEQRVIICDHTKIGRTDVRPFIDLETLKEDCSQVYLITDRYDYTQLLPNYRGHRYHETLIEFNRIHGNSDNYKDLDKSENIIQVDVPSSHNGGGSVEALDREHDAPASTAGFSSLTDFGGSPLPETNNGDLNDSTRREGTPPKK